jgi:hypothetical protein
MWSLDSSCIWSRGPGYGSGSGQEASPCGVTVCELPHEPAAFAAAWAALCDHTNGHASQLVLLPEFAMLEPVWEFEHFDAARWSAITTLNNIQLGRLPELGAEHVVGTRPAGINGRRLNQGYLWSADAGVQSLRSKVLPARRAGKLGGNLVSPGRSGVSSVSRRCCVVRRQHLFRAVGAPRPMGPTPRSTPSWCCRRGRRRWRRR